MSAENVTQKLCDTLQDVHHQGQQVSCTTFDYIFPIKANILSNIYFIKLLSYGFLVFNLAQKVLKVFLDPCLFLI